MIKPFQSSRDKTKEDRDENIVLKLKQTQMKKHQDINCIITEREREQKSSKF